VEGSVNLAGFWRLMGLVEREYDDDDTERLRDRIQRARDYVDSRTFRADLVQALPDSAPRGYLLVTPGDTNLYVGTGAGNPLRKVPTLAL
jgi:hypothetical protein